MRFPDFLIIGAQKCGTTTLYRDLLTNPGICFPVDKEPGNLASPDVTSSEGRRAYARLFQAATDEQLCGDATTAYSKLPDVPGVPERAREICGPELKIVYMVRDPIERIISHHYHEYRAGLADADIDAAVRRDPRYLMYSRYAMQLEPWLQTFGTDQVLVVRLDEYTADRRTEYAKVCRFLGIMSRPELVDADLVFNRGGVERMEPRRWTWLVNNPWYGRHIRPVLSAETRRRARQWLYRRPPSRPDPPTPETIEYLAQELAPDIARQPSLLFGIDESA